MVTVIIRVSRKVAEPLGSIGGVGYMPFISWGSVSFPVVSGLS